MTMQEMLKPAEKLGTASHCRFNLEYDFCYSPSSLFTPRPFPFPPFLSFSFLSQPFPSVQQQRPERLLNKMPPYVSFV